MNTESLHLSHNTRVEPWVTGSALRHVSPAASIVTGSLPGLFRIVLCYHCNSPCKVWTGVVSDTIFQQKAQYLRYPIGVESSSCSNEASSLACQGL